MWLFEEVDLCGFLGCMKGVYLRMFRFFLPTNHPKSQYHKSIRTYISKKGPGFRNSPKFLMLSKLEDPEVVPLEVLRAEARAHPHWRHVEMGGACVSKIRALSGFF